MDCCRWDRTLPKFLWANHFTNGLASQKMNCISRGAGSSTSVQGGSLLWRKRRPTRPAESGARRWNGNSTVKLAGSDRGSSCIVFGGRVGGEPGLLVFDELGGFFADVADGFEGELTGEIVDGVFRWLLDVGGPAFGGVEELGQGFADVAVAGAVVVEVVVELVGDGGELLEEIVGVLFAAGFARMSEELLNCLGAGVEELDEEEDAVVGDVGRFAELFDLAFGEGAFFGLSVKG